MCIRPLKPLFFNFLFLTSLLSLSFFYTTSVEAITPKKNLKTKNLIEQKDPLVSNSSQKRTLVNELVASVNKEIIFKSDVDEYFSTLELRKKLDPLFTQTSLAKKGTAAPHSEVIQFLIENKIIIQEFPISPAEVEETIKGIEKSNNTDRTTLVHAIESEGYHFKQYLKLIEISKSRAALIQKELSERIIITKDDVLTEFYKNYVSNEKVPRSYHLSIIHFSFKNFKSPNAALDQVKQVLKRIEKGQDDDGKPTSFADQAKRYSDDDSAIHDGDIGLLTEDHMSDEIKHEVKKLKIGQVSSILGGHQQSKYYLIKLNDIQSDQKDHFENIKDEIYAKLSQDELHHQITLWLERKKNIYSIHIKGESSIKAIPVLKNKL